jgi:hypothetical protein
MDTTLAAVGQIFVRLFEMRGLDAPALLREQGIDPRQTRDPGLRIPAARWEAVMLRAAALIPDPAFGLRAARCWHPSNLGALGHAWLSAETLHAGFGSLTTASSCSSLDRLPQPGYDGSTWIYIRVRR